MRIVYLMAKQKYIDIAVNEAYKSDHKNFKHGAILVNGKKIISTGYNRPIRNHYDFKSVHAEMQTILDAKRRKMCIKNAEIYVVRVSNNGTMCMSKPCNLCMNILKNNGIRNVIYSTNNKNFENITL